MSRIPLHIRQYKDVEDFVISFFPGGLASCSLFFVMLFFAMTEASAQAFSDYIEESRDYKLVMTKKQPPERVIDFTFFAEPTYTAYPAFKICGECLCITGVLTGKYPELGIKTTSGSPTHRCEWESVEFEQDANLSSRLMEMTQLETRGSELVFSSDDGETMIFRMRTEMESCLKGFELEGKLALKNFCNDLVRAQIYLIDSREIHAYEIASGTTISTGLTRSGIGGSVWTACPVETEPSVPFDDDGLELIRGRHYECR